MKKPGELVRCLCMVGMGPGSDGFVNGLIVARTEISRRVFDPLSVDGEDEWADTSGIEYVVLTDRGIERYHPAYLMGVDGTWGVE